MCAVGAVGELFVFCYQDAHSRTSRRPQSSKSTARPERASLSSHVYVCVTLRSRSPWFRCLSSCGRGGEAICGCRHGGVCRLDSGSGRSFHDTRYVSPLLPLRDAVTIAVAQRSSCLREQHAAFQQQLKRAQAGGHDALAARPFTATPGGTRRAMSASTRSKISKSACGRVETKSRVRHCVPLLWAVAAGVSMGVLGVLRGFSACSVWVPFFVSSRD